MSKTKPIKDKPKHSQFWEFPQIFRGFPERSVIKAYAYQGFLTIMLLGLCFLLILNLYGSFTQPYYLKKLLQNPNDTAALKAVILQNHQIELDQYLKQLLVESDGANAASQIEAEKQQLVKRINELEKLVKQNPNYPDGYALLAVLYFQQSWCDQAVSALNRALELDPNRLVFYDLQEKINECLP